MFCGCGGSISRLAKAAGAEPAGQRRDAKVHTPSTCGSQNAQSHHVWATFGSCDVPQCGKSARACGAKHMWKSKCTITPCLDHLWKLRCGKSAREAHLEVKMHNRTMFGPLLEVAMFKRARTCGAKHIWKSKCAKHEMSNKCTALWREAHLKVKMYRTPNVRAIYGRPDSNCRPDVGKVHAFVSRSTFASPKC